MNVNFIKKVATIKTSSNFGSGIDEELVENSGDFQDLIKSFICCICLDIVKMPMECENCESLYCAECWQILKIAGKPCVLNCSANCIRKANKFVVELLSKLNIRCNGCNNGGIDYHTYVKHIEGCDINQKYSSRDQLNKTIKEKDFQIQQLKQELTILKEKKAAKNKEQEELQQSQINSKSSNNDPEKMKIINELISHTLSTSQKMELYKAAIEGRLVDYKNLILNKKYPILEEVSAQNYYWTSFHYSMHYGQVEIIMFSFEVLKKMNILEKAIRLESNDGRCPILCLLRSNSLTLDKKKEIMDKLLKMYKFNMTDGAKVEMKRRGMENLLSQYNIK